MRRIVVLWAGLVFAATLGPACSSNPKVSITSHQDGDFHFVIEDGGTIELSGIYKNLGLDASLCVWTNEIQVGAPCPIAVVRNLTTKTWTASIPVPFPFGGPDSPLAPLLPVFVTANYGSGGSLQVRDHVALNLAFDVASNHGTGRDEAIVMRLSQQGLGSIASFVADQAGQALDLSALVGTPFLSECVKDFTILGVTYCYIEMVSAEIYAIEAPSAPSINLTSMPGAVRANFSLSDLEFTAKFTFRFRAPLPTAIWSPPMTCFYDAEPALTMTHVDLDLLPNPSDPRFVAATQLNDPTATIFAYTDKVTSCNNGLSGVLAELLDFIEETNELIGSTQIEAALESKLSVAGGAPIAGAVETALADVQLSANLEQMLDMDLAGTVSDVQEDSGGITATFAIHPQPTDTQCSLGNLPAWACPDFAPESYMWPISDPDDWDTVIAPTPYDLLLGLNANALNPLLGALAEQGGLSSGPITELDSCNYTPPPNGPGFPPHGPELDVGCLVGYNPLACAVLGYPCDKALQIRVVPSNKPVVRPNTTMFDENGDPAQASLVLQLRIEVWERDTVNDKLLVQLYASFEAGLSLEVDTDTGELGFDLFVCEDTNPFCTSPIRMQTTISTMPETSIVASLIDVFLGGGGGFLNGTLNDSLQNAVVSFPLPTILGLTPSAITTLEHEQYLSLFTNLQ